MTTLSDNMHQKKGYTKQSPLLLPLLLRRSTTSVVDSMRYSASSSSSYSSVALVATCCLWWQLLLPQQPHSSGIMTASAWTFATRDYYRPTAWRSSTDCRRRPWSCSSSIRPILPTFTPQQQQQQQRYASSVVRASYRPPDYTIDDDDETIPSQETTTTTTTTTKLEESDDILPTTRRRPRIVRTATTRMSGNTRSGTTTTLKNVNTVEDDDDDYDDDDEEEEMERSKTTRKSNMKNPTSAPKKTTTKKVNVNVRGSGSTGSTSGSASWMDRNQQFMNTIGKVAAVDHPTTSKSTTTRGTFIRSSTASSDTAATTTTTGVSRLRNTSSPNKNSNIRGDANNHSDSLNDDDEVNRTFREDFRGTRVFVQGLPEACKWQDLKDHFRVAGKVVFASVSSGLDPNTNRPKGHGIVQFETTAEARTAIRIMRDHPLNGNTLYVRGDIQEDDGSSTLRTKSWNGDRYDDDTDEDDDESNTSGRPKGPTPPSKWKCADTEMAAQHLDPESIQKVFQILKARNQARRRRNYEACDAMREELKDQYNVHIDDRLTMWWIGAAPSNIVDQVQSTGRWKEQPEPATYTREPPPTEWRQIMTTKENDACIDPDLIMGLLKQRDIARREKDFSTADALLLQAQNAPSEAFLTLRIHDESKTWRVWSDNAPVRPNPTLLLSPKNESSPAAEQCISLCLEHAPDKVEEVRQLLVKFPGREYNILKKLKQRYLNQ